MGRHVEQRRARSKRYLSLPRDHAGRKGDVPQDGDSSLVGVFPRLGGGIWAARPPFLWSEGSRPLAAAARSVQMAGRPPLFMSPTGSVDSGC